MGNRSWEVNADCTTFVDVALTFTFLIANTCTKKCDKRLFLSHTKVGDML